MRLIHRYLRPVATAAVALVLAVVTIVMRPQPVGHLRHIEQGPMLSAAAAGPQYVGTGIETILFGAMLTGTALIFVGAMGVIWSRRPPGRHRATV